MMHANRCHTCLKVLDWTGWNADRDVDLKERLEKHGHVRRCCRRMMLTSLDKSEDVLGLLNTQRCLDRKTMLPDADKNRLYSRWFGSDYKAPVVAAALPVIAARRRPQVSRVLKTG